MRILHFVLIYPAIFGHNYPFMHVLPPRCIFPWKKFIHNNNNNNTIYTACVKIHCVRACVIIHP